MKKMKEIKEETISLGLRLWESTYNGYKINIQNSYAGDNNRGLSITIRTWRNYFFRACFSAPKLLLFGAGECNLKSEYWSWIPRLAASRDCLCWQTTTTTATAMAAKVSFHSLAAGKQAICSIIMAFFPSLRHDVSFSFCLGLSPAALPSCLLLQHFFLF